MPGQSWESLETMKDDTERAELGPILDWIRSYEPDPVLVRIFIYPEPDLSEVDLFWAAMLLSEAGYGYQVVCRGEDSGCPE